MKITQIREKDGVEALSVLDFNLLIEKIKTEIKTRPVTGLRQALHFVLPGESCSFAGKLPKVIPAAVFGPCRHYSPLHPAHRGQLRQPPDPGGNQCKYLAINNEEPYEKGAGHGPKNNRTHKNRII